MRRLLILASIGLTASLPLASPAAAGGDDTLPYWAPYRGPTYCHRVFWRERCGYYKLGGFFERRVKVRRAATYRRMK